MRIISSFLVVLLFATSALAVDITITVPIGKAKDMTAIATAEGFANRRAWVRSVLRQAVIDYRRTENQATLRADLAQAEANYKADQIAQHSKDNAKTTALEAGW